MDFIEDCAKCFDELVNSIVAGAVLSLINYAISNYIYKDLGKELE